MSLPVPNLNFRIPIGPVRKSAWWENALVIPMLIVALVRATLFDDLRREDR